MKCQWSFVRTFCSASVSMVAAVGIAQTFPNKPIHIMVGFPAGGASDFVARVLAKEMPAVTNQQAIVENVAGVGGSLGAAKTLAAPADGYTVLLSSPVEAILAPLSYASVNYKAEDFRTIAIGGKTDVMLVTKKDLPVNSVAELVTLMKANSSKPLSYCSVGRGSLYHLIAERFTRLTGAPALHVPYTGFAQCMTDMMGGVIDFAFFPIGGPFPGLVDNGSLKGLAILGDTPSPRLPKVPLVITTKGLEDFKMAVWAGVHASNKIPEAAAVELNKIFTAVFQRPDARKSIEGSGATLFPVMNLAENHALYQKEIAIYTELAKQVGITRQ